MPSSNIELKLSTVSVVLVAQVHNPAIINPDFLKKSGVVGSDWQVDENKPPLSTPLLSQISFNNGVEWRVTPDICTIVEKVEGDLKDSYSIHECAKAYIKTLEHIPYRALGVNWHFSLDSAEEDLQTWMKERFLKSGNWQTSIESTSLSFKVLYPSAVCNITIDIRESKIALNLHHDVVSVDNKKDELCSALDNSERNQAFVEECLNRYIREELS
ncbi:MAG: hypothetical protein OXF52_03845 [Candidatus Dadabacteria bacterium]|nr:hypothetical protein [Candidatus Dadabacteria bacterium]